MDKASTSSAVVPATSTDSNKLVPYSPEAARAMARELLAMSKATSTTLSTVAPIKSQDGVTFPFLVEKVSLNKKTDSNTGESFNVRGIVGSLNGVPGANPKGAFAILKLGIGKVKRVSDAGGVIGKPMSRITKKDIEYIAVTTMKPMMVFTGKADVPTNSYAYAVKASAQISMCPIRMDADADKNVIIVQQMLARANAGGFDGAGSAAATATGSKSTFVGAAAAPAASAAAVVVVGAASAAAVSVAPSHDDSNPMEWYTPTPYSKMFLPPTGVVKAYLDRSSTMMTDLERMCLELEFPELALNTGNLIANYRFCVNWRCGVVTPVTSQEYMGQERDDFLALVKQNPDIERSLIELVRMRIAKLNAAAAGVYDYKDDAEDDTFIIVSRGSDDYEIVVGDRLNNPECPAPIAIAVNYDMNQKRSSQRWSYRTNGPRICIAWTANGPTWPHGTTFKEAEKAKQVRQLSLIGCAYEETVSAAVGITSLPPPGIPKEKKFADWDAILKKMTSGKNQATIVYFCRIDKEETARLESSFTTATDPSIPITYCMSVDNVIVDMSGFLSANALPVTKDGAATVMKVKVPSPEIVASAIPNKVGSTTCLTEEPDKFAACIKAGCEFRILTKKEIRSKYLDKITPQTGDVMVSKDWDNSEATPIAPIREVKYDSFGRIESSKVVDGHVFDSNDDFRDATHDICSDFAYVFAIRPSVKASVERAGSSLRIFNEGGCYDKLGFPIISGGANPNSPPKAPLAIQAAVAAAPQQSSDQVHADQKRAADDAAATSGGDDDGIDDDELARFAVDSGSMAPPAPKKHK